MFPAHVTVTAHVAILDVKFDPIIVFDPTQNVEAGLRVARAPPEDLTAVSV